MKQRVEEAERLKKQGHTCSQAVFAAYAPELGVDKDTALKLSCAFGGGMGGMGMTCGAVTGAFMVISLKYGRIALEDKAAREKSDELVRLFAAKFKERRDNKLDCNDLLGYDRSDPEDVKIMQEKGIFGELCPALVKDAAEILEEIL